MWSSLTLSSAMQQAFTPVELSTTLASADIRSAAAVVLTSAILEFRGTISAAGGSVGDAGTIPDQFIPTIVDIFRWRLLTTFPALKANQTAGRSTSFDTAMSMLAGIRDKSVPVESPTAGVHPRTGSWNSERKVVGRLHPAPPPGQQFQSTPANTGYANPDLPGDSTT